MVFKKDFVPWNKGLKGIHLSQETEFKKGNHPKTEFKEGHTKPLNAYSFPKGELSPCWKGGKKKCLDCGKILASRSKSAKRCAKCYKKYALGENHPSWKGGRHKHSGGYILVAQKTHPGADKHGRIYEHRLVAEKHLKRYLTKEEIVHHINGNREDNRVENLYLFESNSAHRNYHFLSKNDKCEIIIKSNIPYSV